MAFSRVRDCAQFVFLFFRGARKNNNQSENEEKILID
jgi:hypothetical protein